MTKLKTVENIAECIASQMDGRTVTSHEHYRIMLGKELVYELSKYRQSLHTSLVAAVVKKIIEEHIERVGSDKVYTNGKKAAYQDTLTIINSIFKE